jgi:hypothetical protein
MSNGGTKFDQGKPSLTLVPAEALIGMTRALDYGAKKYGRYNYRDGIKHSRLLDAALRHLTAILAGEDIDPESGNSHLWHALASLAMLEWMRVNRPDLNDLYVYKGKKDGR